MLDCPVAAEPRALRRKGVIRDPTPALVTPTNRARSLPGLPFSVDPEGPERRQPWVDLVLLVGNVVRSEPRATGDAESRAIRLAQRCDRLPERDGDSGRDDGAQAQRGARPGDCADADRRPLDPERAGWRVLRPGCRCGVSGSLGDSVRGRLCRYSSGGEAPASPPTGASFRRLPVARSIEVVAGQYECIDEQDFIPGS